MSLFERILCISECLIFWSVSWAAWTQGSLRFLNHTVDLRYLIDVLVKTLLYTLVNFSYPVLALNKSICSILNCTFSYHWSKLCILSVIRSCFSYLGTYTIWKDEATTAFCGGPHGLVLHKHGAVCLAL